MLVTGTLIGLKKDASKGFSIGCRNRKRHNAGFTKIITMIWRDKNLFSSADLLEINK